MREDMAGAAAAAHQGGAAAIGASARFGVHQVLRKVLGDIHELTVAQSEVIRFI